MKKFIKENSVLMIGITLPVLLVVFFLAASSIPKLIVAPPKYNFLFVSRYNANNANAPYRFRVIDKKLKVDFKEVKGRHVTIPKLYLFDSKTESVRQIYIDEPSKKPKDGEKWVSVDIPETKDLILDRSTVSPDDYKFKNGRYRTGGSGLFYSRHGRNLTIEKNGRTVKIFDGQGGYQYSYNTEFLGWIIP